MLVYVNYFVLEPYRGADQIIQLVAKWVGQRSKGFVDPVRLASGISKLKLKDGSTLSSRATGASEEGRRYPFWFGAQLGHPDNITLGRKWITEIGLRQDSEEAPIECSLLLKTEELSARVMAPIQVTRPKLVEQLFLRCNPIAGTPGLRVKQLTQDGAPAFLREVESTDRTHPLVVLSASREGRYPADSDWLQSMLAGLADVVRIPPEEDTFAIGQVAGRRFTAFGGAINVVFPGRMGDNGRYYETRLLRPDDITDLLEGGISVESEVLATVTHRTNLPLSFRHISPEKVSQAVLRSQLLELIGRSRVEGQAGEVDEYVALLEAADQELQAKEEELARARLDYATRDQEAIALQAEVANLKLAGGNMPNGEGKGGSVGELQGVRDSVLSVVKGNPELQEVIDVVESLYGDRIVFLENSRSSAKESDRAGFRQGAKAFELLTKLATDYWQCLAEGKSDQQAKAVFGQTAYSPNEGQALSLSGKRRRTFNYRGRDYLMERHLKHGAKDSAAVTLRVHFEWLASENKIIVGHCGKHLDF